MNEEDLKLFREISERNYASVTQKIETSLTYIISAALVFFIFLNYSLIRCKIADYEFLLVISLSFLFLSFVLMLICKSNTIKYEFDMATFLARMDPNSENQDQELASIWDRNYLNLTTLQTLSSLLLALGIGLQVLFLILNFI